MSSKATSFARLFFRKTDENAQAVRQILSLAIETRADFNMDFFVHNRLVYQLKGACVEVRPDALKVYLRGGVEHLPPVGMEVHVYFSSRVERKSVPFDFLTRVVSAERKGGDSFLWLNLPEKLGHNQRRYNVRVSASKEDIRDFRVWYGKPVVDAEAGDVRLRWVPISLQHVELLDISAGGLQLLVARGSPVYPHLAPREVLLVRGTFELRGRSPQQLIMVGSVVRMSKSEDASRAGLAISFKRWGKMVGGHFVWRDLGRQEGINPLADWVFQLIFNRRRLAREREEDCSSRKKYQGQDDHNQERRQ